MSRCLIEFQDRIKQELIQKFDSYMFRIMETAAIEISVPPPPPILLSLKSKFEYLSFAHFIDFVLGVQIIFIGGNFNVAVHLFGQICRDALKITIHPFSLNFKTMLMSWAIKICLVLYFMNIF